MQIKEILFSSHPKRVFLSHHAPKSQMHKGVNEVFLVAMKNFRGSVVQVKKTLST